MTKSFRTILFAFILLLSPITASSATPMAPSRDLYVSDYASVLFDEHTQLMARFSLELEEATGSQVLVLAVESLDGLSPALYADRVYTDWWNHRLVGADTVFLILSTGEPSLSITAFGSCAEALPDETRQDIAASALAAVSKGNFSTAVLESYKQILLRLYRYYGLEPDEETAAALEPGKSAVSSMETEYTMILAFVLGLLIVLRGLYLSRKYQRKYGGKRLMKRKHFAVERRAFDESDEGDITEIDP
jgi:uncharacterized protein